MKAAASYRLVCNCCGPAAPILPVLLPQPRLVNLPLPTAGLLFAGQGTLLLTARHSHLCHNWLCMPASHTLQHAGVWVRGGGWQLFLRCGGRGVTYQLAPLLVLQQ